MGGVTVEPSNCGGARRPGPERAHRRSIVAVFGDTTYRVPGVAGLTNLFLKDSPFGPCQQPFALRRVSI